MYFTIGEPLEIHLNHAATSGYQHAVTLALFSNSASTDYELLFMPS